MKYSSLAVKSRILAMLDEKNIKAYKILPEIGLSKNTLDGANKSMPKADTLAIIADYLDCSVDYLLGRVDTPNGTYSINNHNTTVNGTQANVINNNTAPEKPDNITEQFFEKFETLSFEEKVDTMQYVNKTYTK